MSVNFVIIDMNHFYFLINAMLSELGCIYRGDDAFIGGSVYT